MEKKKRKAPSNTFRERPQDINRAGRKPNSKTFGDYLREYLEREDEGGKRQVIAEMVDIAVKRAKQGQYQFWDALMNRAYGKVADKIELPNEPAFDPSKLTNEELAQLKTLLEKSKP